METEFAITGDKKFVPNKGVSLATIRKIRKITKKPLDIHIMALNPEKKIKKYLKFKPKNITIHLEATKNPQQRPANTALGLAIKPETNLPKSIPNQISRLLIMAVNPGKGGQAFIPEMLKKIKQAKKFKKEVQVDGGINLKTIKKAIKAGATNLVIGSAIFKSENKQKTLQNIKSMIK
ncbi:ribulose-phosphate 3-epimerase [Candidatus Woesearchaeota archaeon]|nr:ribulose-phosphate 3-epimerase [Candidatus Woesearchaeota archaeon]